MAPLALRALVGRLAGKPVFWLLLLWCSAFLYLHVFRLPCTPMFTQGGQQVYLDGGMRMLDGETIYRDFFDFLPPGTHVVYFVLFKLFGVRAWVPNVMMIVLGVGLIWLSVVISRKVLQGVSVYLPGLVFLTFSYRFQLDATHHWYSAVAVLAALAVLIEARSPERVAAAGALCGVASFFTQTRGAVAVLGLAVFLVWEARKKGLGRRVVLHNEVVLFASFFVTTGALFAYFVCRAGLGRVVDCVVVFLLRYSAAFRDNTWADYLKDWPAYRPWYHLGSLGAWLFMNLFQPFVYVLCFWRYRRESGESAGRPPVPWDRWMLLYLVGLSLLLGDVRAPNSIRLAADSLPALVLLAWLVDSPGWFRQAVRRTLWVAASGFLALTPFTAQLYSPHYLDLPVGRTVFYHSAALEVFEWLLDRTRPGDYCLTVPDFNFYLRLRDPAKVPFLTATDFTRPEQVARTVEELERHRVRFVVWWLDEGPDPLALDGNPPQGDHLGPLRAYVREHYHAVQTLVRGNVSVWERQP